jgi:hypothetical protein
MSYKIQSINTLTKVATCVRHTGEEVAITLGSHPDLKTAIQKTCDDFEKTYQKKADAEAPIPRRARIAIACLIAFNIITLGLLLWSKR